MIQKCKESPSMTVLLKCGSLMSTVRREEGIERAMPTFINVLAHDILEPTSVYTPLVTYKETQKF